MSNVTCPYCQKEAQIDDGFTCKHCGREEDGPTAAEDYVGIVMGLDKYRTVTTGGEWPINDCNECGSEAFVDFGEQDGYESGLRALCFQCGHEVVDRSAEDELSYPPTNCTGCGRVFESIGGELICSDCIQNRLKED